jgi:uncharacterized protein
VTEPDAVLVRFARELRREGVAAGTGAIADFCRAAALVGPTDLYWAGRATLVGRKDDIRTYDRVFHEFFGPDTRPQQLPEATRVRVTHAPAGDEAGEGEEAGDAPTVGLASRVEILREKRFDLCTPEELAELAVLARDFARSLPDRRSRRRRPSRRGPLDMPRTLRRSLRTGGDPFERHRRERRVVQRRLVLLLDVSGSMATYSRALLVLAHALVQERALTEVFCFGTRLTPVTRELLLPDADDALHALTGDVVDWEGGTRIGESLRTFLDTSGHRTTARGAIVVVYSDGLDVGDPDLLRGQMERLSRLAYRVVWLNPLKQDDTYEPLARGMAAALPHVDVFAAGHNWLSVEAALPR